MRRNLNGVDLEECCKTYNVFLLAKIFFATAEKEPSKVSPADLRQTAPLGWINNHEYELPSVIVSFLTGTWVAKKDAG